MNIANLIALSLLCMTLLISVTSSLTLPAKQKRNKQGRLKSENFSPLKRKFNRRKQSRPNYSDTNDKNWGPEDKPREPPKWSESEESLNEDSTSVEEQSGASQGEGQDGNAKDPLPDSGSLEDEGASEVQGPRVMMRKIMKPMKFLERFGYLKETKDEKHGIKAVVKAIKKFQKMYHMKPSGILDAETMSAMRKRRCGMPDTVPPPDDFTSEEEAARVKRKLRQRVKRYETVEPDTKWRKTDLTYRFTNFSKTAKLDEAVQKAAVIKGLKLWQEKSTLTFREAPRGTRADINIMFTQGLHMDGEVNAFDGPSGVLAHAYFPQSGEAHFDDDEEWTDGEFWGTNLMIVAAHEFGHNLGLHHSEIEEALMAPYYRGYEENFQLKDDDVQGIQALYGAPAGEPGEPIPPKPLPTPSLPPTEEPPKPPTAPPPNNCTVAFRAITQVQSRKIYVFNREYMWRLDERNGLDRDFPMPIADLFERAPSHIQAAYFSWETKYLYFFIGNAVWRYYGFMLVNLTVMSSKFIPEKVNAVVQTPNGHICLVEGPFCLRFNEDKMDVTGTPKLLSRYFAGAPWKGYDSILAPRGDPFLYFFEGNFYTKYSIKEQRILKDYPRPKAADWMGPVCGRPSSYLASRFN